MRRASLTADWSYPPAGDLAGYKVLSGTQSGGPYSQVHSGILPPVMKQLTFQAASGQTYYVVMTLVDHASNESDFSAEVSAEVP